MAEYMQNYYTDLVMEGSGRVHVGLPSGYKFVTIINTTNNTLHMQSEKTQHLDPLYAIRILPFMAMTLPIRPDRLQFTFFYENGGGMDKKKAEIIYTIESLNISGLLGASSHSSVTLETDAIGLLKTSDLRFDSNKSLKVVMEGSPEVSISNLPAVQEVHVQNMSQPLFPSAVGVTREISVTAAPSNFTGEIFVIQAHPDNADPILFGRDATGHHHFLMPGMVMQWYGNLSVKNGAAGTLKMGLTQYAK